MKLCNILESRCPTPLLNNFGSLWDFGPRPAFSFRGLKRSSCCRLLKQLPSPMAALSSPKEEKGRWIVTFNSLFDQCLLKGGKGEKWGGREKVGKRRCYC